MPRTLKQVAVDMATAFTKWNLWQGGGASALSELDDVTITNPEADEALVYNGSEWINSVISGGNLGARLTLIGTLNPGDNPTLSVDEYDILICVTLNGAYIKGSATFKRTEFMTATRVEYSIGNNESVWIYPASWNCDEGSTYITNVYGLKIAPIEPIEDIALNDLSNVNIASPVNGNALLYDGSEWKTAMFRFQHCRHMTIRKSYTPAIQR